MYTVWWGDLKEKRELGKHRCKWEDNIKMDLVVVQCESTDRTELDQDRGRCQTLMYAIMNIWVS